MRHLLRGAVPLLLLFAGALLFLYPSNVPAAPIVSSAPAQGLMSGTPTPPPACIPAWQVVPYPTGTALVGVSASGPNDAWIGSTGQVLHWDGSTWAALPLPTTIPQVRLGQDAASAPNNVWGMTSGGAAQWDGSAWMFHPAPTPVPTWYNPSYTFTDIAASAPDNVWMVGEMFASISEIGPYAAAHWDGSAWTVYTSPLYGSAPQAGDKESQPTGAFIHQATLDKVVLTQGGDMWSIGYDYWYGTSNPSGPVVVHGCCDRPTVMAGFAANDHFYDVSAAASNEVWVVGERGNSTPIGLHWNGSIWSEPPLPGGTGALDSVVAISPSDVWAADANGRMLHWDSSVWSIVPSPGVGQLAASGPNDVWAVNPTTIFHWPALAIFHDVDAASPFYSYVQRLACRATISGYACGGPGEPCDGTNRPYYRLGAPVTRGQFSKIISNAAAFADPIPSDQQTFEDVPPTHPFWLYAETLAGRGILSGYGCGGPGEPCVPPGNRPYFRPYAPITRGQIAKVTANAAGYADPIPPTQQTFEDVPPTHPFWLYTERLAAHPGILSGYGCGGPGEPCNPPGNRPYFRSYAQATRGQTAKIVANTFYPAGMAQK